MSGFIVFEDGRAYAASNLTADAVIRAIAGKIAAPEFRRWLWQQQSSVVGPGLTCVDLREVAPSYRPQFYDAVRAALAAATGDGSGDAPADPDGSWLAGLADLTRMIDSWRRGQPVTSFNPHLREPLPATGLRKGPGWGYPAEPVEPAESSI